MNNNNDYMILIEKEKRLKWQSKIQKILQAGFL